MIFAHTSVLLHESVDGLAVKPDGIYVDCTCGGGGHSSEILKLLGDNGRLICIDKDEEALAVCNQRLVSPKVSFFHSDFKQIDEVLNQAGVAKVDGILADLGVSSYQIDNPERGFSYMHGEAPLDMRMDETQSLSAYTVVNTYDERELFTLIRDYGEEKFAGAIVNGIVKARAEKPIETTLELAEIIKENVPQRVRRDGHPARKSFQALRIAVNDELGVLERGLDGAFELLGSGGRLAVITFHSLEDRIVKQKMASWCQGCTCPKDFPVCVCGNKPKAKLVVRKPVCANETELRNNPRARSAKLRICEKI